MSAGRVCRRCAIPHRDDCRTCLGWGVYVAAVDGRRRLVPVSASEAHGDVPARGLVYPCPECDGGHTNVPGARAVQALPPAPEARP
jgi:hypothetical protein